MKKLLLIVVVAALALTLVPLAIAGAPGGGGWKHGHAKFNAVGIVTATTISSDPAVASTITIKVKAGSHIKGLKRTEALFNVAADVKVWQLTEDGAVAMTLADVEVGDRVKVKGTITKAADSSKVYTITSIKYRDLTPTVEPAPEPSAAPVAQ